MSKRAPLRTSDFKMSYSFSCLVAIEVIYDESTKKFYIRIVTVSLSIICMNNSLDQTDRLNHQIEKPQKKPSLKKRLFNIGTHPPCL